MQLAHADLEFAQQLSKQGLLAQTTKCCATGTRSRADSWAVEYPLIANDTDDVDPSVLRREVGALILD